MGAELLGLLRETTLATTAAILVVFALRRPLHAVFGAGAAHAAWALVPAALVAVLLPAASVLVAPVPAPADVAAIAAPTTAGGAATAIPVATWLAIAWLAGAASMFGAQWRRHRAFRNGLGRLRERPDGLLQAEANAGLPAVLGWPARIVLPADFEDRYDAAERELVLCHERVHLQRGDVALGALVAILRCAYWFNPLVHVAAERFRHDQELACDAAVLRRHPDARRRYGAALLKAHLSPEPLPLGGHGFGIHPLKERIAMLKNPSPSPIRWSLGLVAAFALSLAGGAVAWAAQPAAERAPAEGEILLSLVVRIDGGDPQPASAILAAGETHDFAVSGAGEQWTLTMAVTPDAAGRFDLSSKLHRDGELIAEPRLLFDASGAKMMLGEEVDGVFDGIEIDLKAQAGIDPERPPTQVSMQIAGIDGPAPAYPAGASEAGTVMVRLSVDTEGRVLQAAYEAEGSTVPADSPLVAPALAAARQWKVLPEIRNGQPVASEMVVPVRFEPPRQG